jgi:hypothetical protein
MDQPPYGVHAAPPRIPGEEPLNLDLPHGLAQVDRDCNAGRWVHGGEDLSLGDPARV